MGDFSFLIGYKNPDFINVNGEKIAIEVFYDYYKIRCFGSVQKYIKQRKKYFKAFGWETIFFDSKELKNEHNMLKKITGV